jgi:hypothetical protein
MPGCLLNSVHPITRTPPRGPDAARAIVVIGLGLDVPWPYPRFQLTLDEYSVEKHTITGTCVHYNRIEITRPADPGNVTYLVYEVPANTYVYSGRNANATLASSAGLAFTVPPGATVYLGDYVYVGNKTMQYRHDIDAARSGARALLPPGTVLEPAAPAAVTHAAPLLCTP